MNNIFFYGVSQGFFCLLRVFRVLSCPLCLFLVQIFLGAFLTHPSHSYPSALRPLLPHDCPTSLLSLGSSSLIMHHFLRLHPSFAGRNSFYGSSRFSADSLNPPSSPCIFCLSFPFLNTSSHFFPLLHINSWLSFFFIRSKFFFCILIVSSCLPHDILCPGPILFFFLHASFS